MLTLKVKLRLNKEQIYIQKRLGLDYLFKIYIFLGLIIGIIIS